MPGEGAPLRAIEAVALQKGAGFVAPMAVDPKDLLLLAIDAKHLFTAHATWLGFRRGTLLRKYMLDFAQLLAPHLERRLIDRAHRCANAAEVAKLFGDTDVPQR